MVGGGGGGGGAWGANRGSRLIPLLNRLYVDITCTVAKRHYGASCMSCIFLAELQIAMVDNPTVLNSYY